MVIADSGQADHASERSDAVVSAYRDLLASRSSSYLFQFVIVRGVEAGAVLAPGSAPPPYGMLIPLTPWPCPPVVCRGRASSGPSA